MRHKLLGNAIGNGKLIVATINFERKERRRKKILNAK